RVAATCHVARRHPHLPRIGRLRGRSGVAGRPPLDSAARTGGDLQHGRGPEVRRSHPRQSAADRFGSAAELGAYRHLAASYSLPPISMLPRPPRWLRTEPSSALLPAGPAWARTRPANREKGSDWSQTLPGPVSVARNKPSPPNSVFLKPPVK